LGPTAFTEALRKTGQGQETILLIVIQTFEYLGSVEAPDRERGEAVAIKQFPLDDDAQASRVPVLYIEAAHRLADLDRFAALCPQLVTAKAVGSGHFLSLEVPEQITR
jgi:hypothetical protein